MTNREQFRVTSYLQYGGGKGLYKPTASDPGGGFEMRLDKFGGHRHFASYFRYHEGGGEDGSETNPGARNRLMVERSAQGWMTDRYNELLQSHNIHNLVCVSGRALWMDATGDPEKIMPIEDGADPEDPASWADIAEFMRQWAIRYAHDTAAYIGDARVGVGYTGDQAYLNNTPMAGLGTVDALQALNEPNHRWNGSPHGPLSPKATAAAFSAIYTAVRSVSDIELYTPPPIAGDTVYLEEFAQELQAFLGVDGWHGVVLAFHWYMRENDQAQGGGEDTGAAPEDVGAKEKGDEMDRICETYGFAGWACTETGHSAMYPGSEDDHKNAAPIQEGFTQEESKGILALRTHLVWSSCQYYVATYFWHCAHNYDGGAYANGGWCYRQTPGRTDWDKAPQLDVVEEWLDVWGDWYSELGSYWVEQDGENMGYFIRQIKGRDTALLGWTNGANATINGLALTPMPTRVDSPTPTGTRVKVDTGTERFHTDYPPPGGGLRWRNFNTFPLFMWGGYHSIEGMETNNRESIKLVTFQFLTPEGWNGYHNFWVGAWILPDGAYTIGRLEAVDEDNDHTDVLALTFGGLAVPGLHERMKAATVAFTLDDLNAYTVVERF